MNKEKIYKTLRYAMSFIFLWAFADKTFGLGFATTAENAWIAGGSPTTGFLLNGTHGTFATFFQSLASSGFVDWLFMLGLLFIGIALLKRTCVKWGAIAGVFMMLLMYLSAFPPVNNPIIDYHLVYILVLGILALENKN